MLLDHKLTLDSYALGNKGLCRCKAPAGIFLLFGPSGEAGKIMSAVEQRFLSQSLTTLALTLPARQALKRP